MRTGKTCVMQLEKYKPKNIERVILQSLKLEMKNGKIPVYMKTMKVSSIEFVGVNSLRFNQRVQVGQFIESEYQEQKEMVRKTGMVKPLLVERITHKVLSGNLLLLIAMELGRTHVPVVFTDLKSKQNQVLRPVA